MAFRSSTLLCRTLTKRATVSGSTNWARMSQRHLTGTSIPAEAKIFISDSDGKPQEISALDFFKGKKVALFSVPGAYTGTCSAVHFPGYLDKYEDLKQKGVDSVACIAINDTFVMRSWAESCGDVSGKIALISDTSSNGLNNALGKTIDLSAAGLGVRSVRYSAIIDDGKVVFFAEEEKPGEVNVSGADDLLAAL